MNTDRLLVKAKNVYHPDKWEIGFYTNSEEPMDEGPILLHYLDVKGHGPTLIDPDTICQCTGLKDKHGALIFEGDVVKYKGSTQHGIFHIEAWPLMTIIWDNDTTNFIGPVTPLWYYQCPEELEVIGNIHDNGKAVK